MSLDKILLKHYVLYPEMQIQDMVKLIYQNEFGGGHLIKNKEDSLKRLQEEYHSIGGYSFSCNQSDGSINSNMEQHNQLFVDIGNNLCRLDLKVLKKIRDKNICNIDLKTINSFFVNTSNSVFGSIQRFEKKLEILMECCRSKILPYHVTEVEDYLREYKAKGYPAVSHSEVYRSAYSPSYRVVEARYRNFFEIFCKIDVLLKSKDRVIVAIDGNCCSGKTTLASFVANVYHECNVFHMDDFFLTPELRTEKRMKEVGGNVDYVRFKNEVIEGLKSGKEFCYRKYDCRQQILLEPTKVIPGKLNIIEGSYSMHPTLRENYDLKIFLHVDPEEQSRRILERNGEQMHKIFINLWIPLENTYFTEMRIREQCDLVFKT